MSHLCKNNLHKQYSTSATSTVLAPRSTLFPAIAFIYIRLPAIFLYVSVPGSGFWFWAPVFASQTRIYRKSREVHTVTGGLLSWMWLTGIEPAYADWPLVSKRPGTRRLNRLGGSNRGIRILFFLVRLLCRFQGLKNCTASKFAGCETFF